MHVVDTCCRATDVAIVTLITAVTPDSFTKELSDMFYAMNQCQAHYSSMHG